MFGSNSTTSACQLIDTKPERSMFLELPAEIRLHIYSYLFTGPVQATGITNRGGNILISRGVTSGVGHISIVSNGENWIILSMVKPPGFSLGSTAMLRTCRVVHEEVLDLLHSNILWVIDIKSSAVNSPPDYIRQPLIIAGPSKNTTFMRSISHSHVRQFVIPEKDELLHAAFELHCVLGCLRPDRKSSDVSFTSQVDSWDLITHLVRNTPVSSHP